MDKNRNFRQKSKFWTKIEILDKNRIFEKIEIFVSKCSLKTLFFSDFQQMRLSNVDLPDVFYEEDEDDEFDEYQSPRLSPRSRHDSGICDIQRRQMREGKTKK